MGKATSIIFALVLLLAVASAADTKNTASDSSSISTSSSSSKLPLRYVEITFENDYKDNASQVVEEFSKGLIHKIVKNVTQRNLTLIYVRFKTEADAATFIQRVTESKSELAALVEDIRAVDVSYVLEARDEFESSEEYKPELDVILGVLAGIVAFLIIGSISIDQALKEKHG